MYYGLGKADGRLPVPGKPIGWAGAPGIHALTQLPSRDTHLRRQIQRQFWHKKELRSKDDNKGEVRQDTTFFRELNSNFRISNMEAAGQIPVRKSALISRILVKFEHDTKIEDINDVLDNGILNLHIEGEDACRWVHFNKLNDYDYEVRLEMTPLGAGQSFNVTYSVFGDGNPVTVTIVLEALTDEPI